MQRLKFVKTLALVQALLGAVAAQAVSKIAAVPLTAPKEPKALEWEFVEELKLPERNPAPAAGAHPGDLKEPWLKNRISRCYFSPIKRAPYFRDELADDVDYYPDAYLERLKNEGVNGLWISGEFRELAETSFNRRDPKGLKRLAKLSRTVAKCKAHVGLWRLPASAGRRR